LDGGVTAAEAAQIALLNNPDLRAACYAVGIGRAELVQAGLLSNPSLGVALRLPSGGGLAGLEADLAQNIAELWQIGARQRGAQRALDQAILVVAAQAADIVTRAKSAYFAAVAADRRRGIAERNLEVTQAVLELADLRRSAGAGSDLDVNLTRGLVLETRLAVQQARLAASDARRALAGVLGLSLAAGDLGLSEDLAQIPDRTLAVEPLIEVALAERLDVGALQQAVFAAEERLVLEQWRVFPSLEIGVALERGERGRAEGRDLLADTARASIAAGQLTAPEIEPRSARDVHTDFSIGPSLALELPIFDQNQAQIARARYELEQRRQQLAGLRQAVRRDVRGAVEQAHSAWGVARFYRDEIVPQAERTLELSRESYRAGKSAVLAVLEAERAYLAAQDGHVQALRVAAAAIPQLELEVGLPFDLIVEVADRAADRHQRGDEGGAALAERAVHGSDTEQSRAGDAQ
jgi:cobalt-zinc-cadmium efflux system outer membrane protein